MLLLDDPDLDLRVHVCVQTHRNAIHAERPDRLVQLDLALLHMQPLRFELGGDVGGGDRSEQLALLTDACREGQRNLLELFCHLSRRAAAELKHQTCTAMERERIAACARVTVLAPGAVRSFDP